MPLVRCPIHNIPYNSDNPRGCPACAREREGATTTAAQELARASRATRAVVPPPASPPAPPAAAELERDQPIPAPPSIAALPPRASRRNTAPRRTGPQGQPLEEWAPVTRQPQPVTGEVGLPRRIQLYLQSHPPVAAGAALGTILVLWMIWALVPRFSEQLDPPPLSADARPIPFSVNVPITTAFTLLGTRPPGVHPSDRRLARYSYGPDVQVDEYNGQIYAITLATSAYAWGGLRVGMDETVTRGQLALVGEVKDARTRVATPQTVGGYSVYQSRDQRPERTLTAQIRPPNGCFDVTVRLSPLILGTVSKGSASYVAVARSGEPEAWMASEIRIVSHHWLVVPANPDEGEC